MIVLLLFYIMIIIKCFDYDEFPFLRGGLIFKNELKIFVLSPILNPNNFIKIKKRNY